MTGPALPGRMVAVVDYASTSEPYAMRCKACRMRLLRDPVVLARHAAEKHRGEVGTVEEPLTGWSLP